MEYLSYIVAVCMIFLLLLLALLYSRWRQNRLLKTELEAMIDQCKELFNFSEDALIAFSKNGRISYANKRCKKMLSLPEEYIGKTLDPMPKVKIKDEWIDLDQLVLQTKPHKKRHISVYSDVQMRTEPYARDWIPVAIYIEKSSPERYFGKWQDAVIIHDLTKDQAYKEAAYRHKLTGLPNHAKAMVDLNKLFTSIHQHNKKLALMVIDIDNFTRIRAMLGYQKSEEMLIRCGEYLESFSKENGLQVYHTYSNKFMLIMPNITSVDDAAYMVQKIQHALGSLYQLNGIPFHLTVSVGISIFPDGSTTRNLIDHAYKALSEAKKKGYGQIKIYQTENETFEIDETELFHEAHQALHSQEFEVYYQPLVDAKSREVVSAEALIRWKHPKYGFIPPYMFISMLEKSSAIVELDRFVLSEVLKQLKRWEMFKFKPISVSMNMSFVEIETEGYVAHIKQEIVKHQIAADRLKFEVTEGVAMKNQAFAMQQIHRLKNLGVTIALDDFGTGYTSFSYLKMFPADILKIDRSMIAHLLQSEEDQRIVNAMIELGHNLGMKVVVEGIEDAKTADLLESFGCDYFQGYYFGKPQPAYEFQELIRR